MSSVSSIATSHRPRAFAIVLATAVSVALAGCSQPAASPTAQATAAPEQPAEGASIYQTPLTGVCPAKVVVQTNWFPQPDHGYTYQLIGPNGTVDPDKVTYTGPLAQTGIELEIRAGGPAIGFQQVSSILQQDESILFGYIGTDEAIQNSKDAPTVAVFASYDRNPQTWIWGEPSWDFKSTADIGRSGATVLAFEGSAYLDVFVGKGLLNRDQIDTSFQGGPSRFVAEDGKVVQQAFVTSEPYSYEHEVPEWGKPVQYLLVGDDFPVYQSALSIRADALDANRDCLAALVPLFQQALVDYAADPGPVNELLVDYVAQLEGGGFVLSPEKAANASRLQRELELISNGSNGTIGDFDEARVQGLIDDLEPVFAGQGKELKAGLAPSDVVTNEFLDSSIRLP